MGAISFYIPVKERIMVTNLEGAQEGLIDAHHGTRIVKLATIVGRGEQRDQVPLREELITILHDLWSAKTD